MGPTKRDLNLEPCYNKASELKTEPREAATELINRIISKHEYSV
jgi:hypothetical protein